MMERECLAILWGVNKYRPYIEGTLFTIFTDHNSRNWLQNLRDATGRLSRWAMKMAQFDTEIVHPKDKTHQVPDAFSRMFSVEVERLATNAAMRGSWYARRYNAIPIESIKFSIYRIGKLKMDLSTSSRP